MPEFATTRTPGSNTSNYGLADHIADGHAHDQYLRVEDYLGGSAGLPTSGEMLQHKADPDAHGSTYVKPATLNSYALKTDLNAYALKTDLDGFALRTDLGLLQPKSEMALYALKTDLDGFALQSELDAFQLKSDMAPYALKSELDVYQLKSSMTLYALKTNLNAYTPISVMDEYVRWDDLPEGQVITLSDDYKTSNSNVAASLAAANGVYIELQTHKSAFAQGAETDHKDSTGSELYAHRTHTHTPADIGAAPEAHDHDDRYSLLDHRHDGLYAPIVHSHNYLTEASLAEVGIFPEAIKLDAGDNPEYNTVATFDDLENLLSEDVEDGGYYLVTDTGLWYQASVTPGTDEAPDPTITWAEVADPGISETLPIDFDTQVVQGNIGITADLMVTAVHGPEFSTPPTGISTLTVVVTTVSGSEEELNKVVALTQTLTTSAGIYFRVGEGNYDEATASMVYTFDEWNTTSNSGKNLFDVFYSLSGETPRGAYPLWTGVTLVGARTSYTGFWDKAISLRNSGKLRVVTADEYEAELTAYGECGAFVIDEAAGSIRLPKITRFIGTISDISDIGISMNDTIPDHRHSIAMHWISGNGTPGAGMSTSNPSSEERITSATLAIAGSSTEIGSEVSPRHVKLALYIQVYNVAVSAAESQASDGDLDALINSLNEKAPLVSPTLSGIPTAPTASAGSTNLQIANTTYVGTGIANHNSDELAHSTLFATKMTTPTGGVVGNVLTKTATGFAWAAPSTPVSTWFEYTYNPMLELTRDHGEQVKITLNGDLAIVADPVLSATEPTMLMEIDCGSTERTVTIGGVTVLDAKTGVWHIGWAWNGTTTRRYPPVEVS